MKAKSRNIVAGIISEESPNSAFITVLKNQIENVDEKKVLRQD